MAIPVKKVCPKGHTFFKSSDCPVCPTCEAERMKAQSGDLPKIGAPATRALNRLGVTTLAQLTKHSEKELRALHGFGPKAMKIIKSELAVSGKSLKAER